jgi:hypothetical protein
MRHHDPLVSRQGHGAFDGVKALTDSLLTANLMLKKEALKGAAPGELGGFKRGPLAKKITKELGLLMGAPLEHVRKIRLQRTGQSIRQPDAIAHQPTPVLHQLGQGAHLGTLGNERLELISVPK